MGQLTGKSIVVLGASGGVGAKIVGHMSMQGARVLAVARRRDGLDYLAKELAAVEVLALDATQEDAPNKVFGALLPDALVVCGGAQPPTRPVHELDWPQFSVNWDTDVKISFLFCKAALEKPLSHGSVVILISSGAALGGSPISGGYAGAKRTQMLMANYCQKESDRLALGIRFIALAPSMIMPDTDLGARAVEGYSKYLGVSTADFIRGMKSPQSTVQVAEAVVELLAHTESHKGAIFKVSSEGLASIPQ